MDKNKKHLYTTDTQIRVRYGETDQMGYCYYGNYAQYFEVGRVETLREMGMSYKDLETEGYMLPVLDFSVKYISPAFYDDLLTITTYVKTLNGIRLSFEYEVRNAKNLLISEAKTTHVFVKKMTMKPTLPPENFVSLMNSKSKSNATEE